MAYPSSTDSFTTKNDGDTISAAHVNALQAAVVAIETELGNDPSGASADVVTRLNALDTTVAGKLSTTTASGTYGLIVEGVNTVAASGASVTIPAVTTASISRVTLTANCTFTFPAATAGTAFTLAVTQDGTGGRSVTWPVSVKWPGGVAPTASASAGKVDLYVFTCLDGASWYGAQVGADIR